MTWHEDREISPGVPDCSYVMKGGNHETGWLELKAVADTETVRLKVEPSQVRWIEAHCGICPVHVLIAVGHYWHLVDGKHIQELAVPIQQDRLALISEKSFHQMVARDMLAHWLRVLTRKG